MKIDFLFVAGLLVYTSGFSQNAWIGTTLSTEKQQMAGAPKTNVRSNATGYDLSDFLIQSKQQEQVIKKTHLGLGLNYIIALEGSFPSQGFPQVQGTMIGEIKIFTGYATPYGWAFCHGQLLLTADYPTLFNLIGTSFGGDGRNNFALPDLRSAVPVGVSKGGYLGEPSN